MTRNKAGWALLLRRRCKTTWHLTTLLTPRATFLPNILIIFLLNHHILMRVRSLRRRFTLRQPLFTIPGIP